MQTGFSFYGPVSLRVNGRWVSGNYNAFILDEHHLLAFTLGAHKRATR